MAAGRRGRWPLGLVAVALAACSASSTGGTSSSTEASSGAPSLALRDAAVEPLELHDAQLGVAFSAEQAAELVADPSGIDFAHDALLCVFLGLRPTDGWSLDLRTASLTGDLLSIAARENAPRGNAAAKETYPADCALIDRAALPAGELTVRADDINSDEFIVDAVVTVPAGESAP